MKLPFPSKFAVGNSLFSATIFLTFALPFIILGYPTALIAYLISPFISFGIVKLHRSRAKQHYFTVKTNAELLWEVRQELDKANSTLDEIELRVIINEPKGGET